MKTSNKILIALLIVVFTLPLLFAFSLKGKVQRGEFTVEKNKNYEGEKDMNGTFAAYKVVKVVAPRPENLRCVFHASGDMAFKYTQRSGEDSLILSNINDTLLIQYVPLRKVDKSVDREWSYQINVNVNLPYINSLVVDGAVVIIDSFPATSENMSVIIKNRGEIKDGSRKHSNSEEDLGRVTIKETQPIVETKVAKGGVITFINEKIRGGAINLIKTKAPLVDIKELLVYNMMNRI